jgi:putative DNA primase/helicase
MSAAELALNRWPGLLAHFGIDRDALTGKHVPCPACGGKDRFRFDDKEGRGTFFCSHCGSGDGFKLLGLLKGWTFREAAKEIEAIVGTIPATAAASKPNEADKLAICRRMWAESLAVVPGDPVALYLARRCCVESVPLVIRFHPRLAYRHDDASVTHHPAMIGRVQDVTGTGCAIHRTYLTDAGEKASLDPSKKLTGSLPAGAAIRLFPPCECIGVAEGIETAMSAFALFGVPTWAAVTAGGLERWTPPEGTERVIVFGDNDASGTGQAAAWVLAKRLIAGGIEAEVRIPSQAGTDWNDIYQESK